MNLYLCVSETLESYGGEYEPPEIYCIVEYVVAETRAKAKYAAWSTDNEYFTHDMIDMPKMSVRLVAKNVDFPAGFLTEEEVFKLYPDKAIKLWHFTEEEAESVLELSNPSVA